MIAQEDHEESMMVALSLAVKRIVGISLVEALKMGLLQKEEVLMVLLEEISEGKIAHVAHVVMIVMVDFVEEMRGVASRFVRVKIVTGTLTSKNKNQRNKEKAEE